MKSFLLSATVAAFVVGAGGPAFATDSSAASPQTADQYGTWPHRWAKDDERAATEALNDLEAHGYALFSNFHRKGNDFEASVMDGGKPVKLLIDPARDSVNRES